MLLESDGAAVHALHLVREHASRGAASAGFWFWPVSPDDPPHSHVLCPCSVPCFFSTAGCCGGAGNSHQKGTYFFYLRFCQRSLNSMLQSVSKKNSMLKTNLQCSNQTSQSLNSSPYSMFDRLVLINSFICSSSFRKSSLGHVWAGLLLKKLLHLLFIISKRQKKIFALSRNGVVRRNTPERIQR
jgi:hypothetical protein